MTDTVLMGPADPDAFRVPVGRNRFYTDPLPACEIAEEDDENRSYPSISHVKKAAGQDWSYVALRQVSRATANDFSRLAEWDSSRRAEGLQMIRRHTQRIAAGRGTIIHAWGEDLLNGREMREYSPEDLLTQELPGEALAEARLYRRALLDFFDVYKPRLIAAEFVVIDRSLNGHGYGGTPDGIWELRGGPKPGVYAFDYKSRGEGSNHGAHPDEAAQVAAGQVADYMIVAGPNGEAVRQPIPKVDGGMIVSIKPDGARVYPIDISKAADDWRARHEWWVSRKREKEAIGRMWRVVRAAS